MTDAFLPANEGAKRIDANEVVTSVGPVLQQRVQIIGGFEIPPFDYISFGYTGSDVTTVTYRTGGSTGTVLAVLSFEYSSGNVTSILKTTGD